MRLEKYWGYTIVIHKPKRQRGYLWAVKDGKYELRSGQAFVETKKQVMEIAKEQIRGIGRSKEFGT